MDCPHCLEIPGDCPRCSQGDTIGDLEGHEYRHGMYRILSAEGGQNHE
jgi:hypothetical protein